jgi:20S proteasome subunit beta 2
MMNDDNTGPVGGFNFGNVARNKVLEASGFPAPKATKTGTTIVGLVFANGIVLGADTRATAGNIVADKNCSKIHRIAPRIYCCGAGTAADTEFTTRNIESQMELLRLNVGTEIPVVVACRLLKQKLFRYQGHIGAALILGGVDRNGAHLYQIYPHGSTDKLPFITMGSGSLAAMAVFENGWKPGLTEEEAVKLVDAAIQAGITNDLGSGSNVDINVIRNDSNEVTIHRPYKVIAKKGQRVGKYLYPKGTTATIGEPRVIPVEVVDEEVMDTD